MIKQRIAVTSCTILFVMCGALNIAQAAGDNDGFADKIAKQSYALGMQTARSVANFPIDVDTEAFLQGVQDALGSGDTRLTERESKVVYQGLVRDIQVARYAEIKKEASANLQAGKTFLAGNQAKDGVKVTDSGLQYKILEKGDGPQPDANDVVTVHYVGKLVDGTVFDSSRKRGAPATFAVNRVIAGWTEALQMMHEGARYKLFIPAKLAYGNQGRGDIIGPNETLIFDVELLKVHKKK